PWGTFWSGLATVDPLSVFLHHRKRSRPRPEAAQRALLRSHDTDRPASMSSKTKLALVLALIGFALNSILCRMALGSRAIDAWSFTAVRLIRGAVGLVVLAPVSGRNAGERSGASFMSASALFVYAAAFSLAYLRLSAGVG